MIDFSEALRARVRTMSTEDIRATQTRRASREAQRAKASFIEARWGSPEDATAVVKSLAVHIGPATNGAHDILQLSQGSTFHETIILIPSVYRLLAGGPGQDGTQDRFMVRADGAGSERVTVDRAALADVVARERPDAMALANNILEKEDLAPRHPYTRKVETFEARWRSEFVRLRFDAAVAPLHSRTMLLKAGRDYVGLWLCRDAPPPSGPIDALIHPAILRSKSTAGNAGSNDKALETTPNALFAQSFGSGPKRMLVLDLACLRRAIEAIAADEERDAAITGFYSFVAHNAQAAK